MKNIEKKWMLFMIATFVTFFGIGYTLLKETFALNDVNNTVQELKPNYDNSNEYDITLSDNCDLSDIVFNEGEINFKKDVFEYDLFVNDVKKIEIEPILALSSLECLIHDEFNEEENNFVVTVYALDEVVSVYKINVLEKELDNNNLDDKNKDIDYTYIFIAIIGVLVLINIYRIVRNLRSK